MALGPNCIIFGTVFPCPCDGIVSVKIRTVFAEISLVCIFHNWWYGYFAEVDKFGLYIISYGSSYEAWS